MNRMAFLLSFALLSATNANAQISEGASAFCRDIYQKHYINFNENPDVPLVRKLLEADAYLSKYSLMESQKFAEDNAADNDHSRNRAFPWENMRGFANQGVYRDFIRLAGHEPSCVGACYNDNGTKAIWSHFSYYIETKAGPKGRAICVFHWAQ